MKKRVFAIVPTVILCILLFYLIKPTPLLKSYPYCIQQLCIIFILYAVSILRFIFVVKWYKRRFSIASKERR